MLLRGGGNWLWWLVGTAFAKPAALLLELRKVFIDGKVWSVIQLVEEQVL